MMEPDTRSANDLDTLAETVFDTLARQFPICTSSDEFHFFPQCRIDGLDGSLWDNFSAGAIAGICREMQRWEECLEPVAEAPIIHPSAPSSAHVVDAAMLMRMVRTLRRQLSEVRPHATQPTFYLTIAGIGLAEALEANPSAYRSRLQSLPAFLDQAVDTLVDLPRQFRDLGIEMLERQWEWLAGLGIPDDLQRPIHRAYRRLGDHLRQVTVREAFLPAVDLYAEIARDHMGSDLEPEEILSELETELAETRSLLESGAARLNPGSSWQTVVAGLPRPRSDPDDPGAVYRGTIAELAEHCTRKSLAPSDLAAQCPVRVLEIPAYMRPVRSSAAYSMPPGHPPRGGTFFIENKGSGQPPSADLRLLTAHETYPGHHLLDTCRWRHKRLVRRQIEFPIFYEGWASFSEELLFDTGFFGGTADRLLMAKRRFWRALRGLTDLDIHMRRLSGDAAARRLVEAGLTPKTARTMIHRYCLKPGYQLAYTLGRRRFRRLYRRWRRRSDDPTAFARRVLDQGEIDFAHLELMLLKGG